MREIPFNQVLNFPDHLHNIVCKQKGLLKNSKLNPSSYFSVLPSGDILDDPELDAFLSGELFEEEFEYTALDQSSIASTVRTERGTKFNVYSKVVPIPGFYRNSEANPSREEQAGATKTSLSYREIKVPPSSQAHLHENNSAGFLARRLYTKQLTQGSLLIPDDGASVETVSPRPQIPSIQVNNNIYVSTYASSKHSPRKREVHIPTVVSVQEVNESPSSRCSGIQSPSKKSSEGTRKPERKPFRGRSEAQPAVRDPQREPALPKKKGKKKKRVHDKTAIPQTAEVPASKPAAAKVARKGGLAGPLRGIQASDQEQSFLFPKRMRSQSENLTPGNDSEPEVQAKFETPAQNTKAKEAAGLELGAASNLPQERDLSMISGVNETESPLLKSPGKNKVVLQPIKPESRDILRSEVKLKIITKNNPTHHSKQGSLNLKSDLSIDLKISSKQAASLMKANTQDLSKSFLPKQDPVKSPKTFSGLKPFELSNRLLDSMSQYLKQADSPLKSLEFKQKPGTSVLDSVQTIEQVPTSNSEALHMVLKKNGKIHSAKQIQHLDDMSKSKLEAKKSQDKSVLDEPVRKKQSAALHRSGLAHSQPDHFHANLPKREVAKKSAKLDSSTSIRMEGKKAPASSHLKASAAQCDPFMAQIFSNKLNPNGSKVYCSATAVSAYSGSKPISSISKLTSVRKDSSVHRNLKSNSRISDSKPSSLSKRVTQQEPPKDGSTAGAMDPKRFALASEQTCREVNLRLHEKKTTISIYDCKITKEVPALAFKESQIADAKLAKSSIAAKLYQDSALFSRQAFRDKTVRGSSRTEASNPYPQLDLSNQGKPLHLNREKSPAIGLRVERTKKLFSSHFEKSNISLNPKPTSQVPKQNFYSSHRNIDNPPADHQASSRLMAQPVQQTSRLKGTPVAQERPRASKMLSGKSLKK